MRGAYLPPTGAHVVLGVSATLECNGVVCAVFAG
jgi:hypothetical protein